MNLFQMILEDDCFTLAALVAILITVGNQAVKGHPICYRNARRAAGLMYVVFGIYALVQVRPGNASGLLFVAWRGLFAAGLTLGLASIAFPILSIVYRSLKITPRRPTTPAPAPKVIRVPVPPSQSQIEAEVERQKQLLPPPDPVEVAEKKAMEIGKQLERLSLNETDKEAIRNQAEINVLKALKEKLGG